MTGVDPVPGTSVTVGVAGCGAMGLPMARRLRDAGFDVRGLDVRPRHEFGDFAAHLCDDGSAFAAHAEVVFSVVRDASQTEQLLFDDQRVLHAASPPRLLVLCSTLSPRYVRSLADRMPAGTTLVDAPMSGAPWAAEHGRLTFMLGGPPDALATIAPMLRAMGEHCHELGPLGAGATAKVLNNLVAASSVVAVRRAMAAAAELGLAPARLREVMRQSSGATWFGDRFDDIAWAREGHDAGNTIGILVKDVRAMQDAVDGIDALGAPLFEEAVIEALQRLEPWSEPGA